MFYVDHGGGYSSSPEYTRLRINVYEHIFFHYIVVGYSSIPGYGSLMDLDTNSNWALFIAVRLPPYYGSVTNDVRGAMLSYFTFVLRSTPQIASLFLS